MNGALIVLIPVVLVIVIMLVVIGATDPGQWRRTGAVKTVVTPLANGWRREQVMHEFVDVAKEGHFKWDALEEHDDISPTGIKVHVDRRDYGW